MAGRWSSDSCEVIFHKDIHASTLAVDCVGTWALLAGRKSLAFVDLRDTSKPPVKVPRQSKWDIGCVQWNRHASHAHRFVTACNQRLDVFDFRDASASHLSSLKAHSRTVSDVDWSPFDVNIVASCSVDTFTYIWDVRDPKKPVKYFQTVSGAYQVKWNKVVNNLFATTHDGDVRIWDPRKENTPIGYISAHSSKIHGLDWSHVDEYKLVTASQDCTIRFWDYQNPRRIETMINSWNPVWRARYTPFGMGVMSVVVPQLRRGENTAYLWNQDNTQSHVHSFVGHQDVILEFQWRKQAEGMVDHQLVTWSKDQSLRIWKVDPSLQKLCGHETADDIPIHIDNLTLTPSLHQPPSSSSSSSSTSSSSHHHQQHHNNHHYHHYHKGERLSAISESKSIIHPADKSKTDSLCVGMVSGSQSSSVSGTNRLSPANNVLNDGLAHHDGINGGSQGEKEDRQSMLEKKYKVEKVKAPTNHSSSHAPLPSSHLVPMFPDGRYEDNNVPFPRTCGAKFSSNDFLVIFNVPSSMKKLDQENGVTPRSLSDLVRMTAPSQWMRPQHPPPSMFSVVNLFGSPPPPVPSEGVSISDFFTEKHACVRKHSNHKHSHSHSHSHSRSRDGTDGKKDKEREMTDRVKKRVQKVGRIQVYNISSINPINLFLAKHYKLDLVDKRGCCEHNAKMASKAGREDLVQLWTGICHIFQALETSHGDLDDSQRPWAMHPFCRPLVEKFLKYYEKQQDVQTMAMIGCMFWEEEIRNREPERMRLASPHLSRPDSNISFEAAHVESTLASSADSGWELLMNKGKRSRSLSESFDDFNAIEKELLEPDERETALDREMENERILQMNNNSKILNPEMRNQYEEIKRAYADILYKWGLLNQRTQVLKHTVSAQVDKKIEFSFPCSSCAESQKNVQCNRCYYPSLNCSICHVGVRGPANVCLACGHGGHSGHMMDWFHSNSQCPSGCGCNCLQEAPL